MDEWKVEESYRHPSAKHGIHGVVSIDDVSSTPSDVVLEVMISVRSTSESRL